MISPFKEEMFRLITEWENKYPNDNSIVHYTDFLKIRNEVCYYQFNPIVFHQLLCLVVEEWSSNKKISRLSLVTTIRRYYKKNQIQAEQLSPDSRSKIFELYKKCFDESQFVSALQLEEVQRQCNQLMMNLPLGENEERWLCENRMRSPFILNRLLRYPVKSNVISAFARNNSSLLEMRKRRAEHLSWILDEEPDFKIEPKLLIDDFEVLTKIDEHLVQTYRDELNANKIISRDFNFIDLDEPQLELSRRFYNPTLSNKETPDFDFLREDFYNKLPLTLQITGIWAIGYSRLENCVKSEILKPYFRAETIKSLIKVCKKNKNAEFLKWMLQQ